MKRRTTDAEGENTAPSREEIETLCILHAIGSHGCDMNDLAELLGLSRGLAAAVVEGTGQLISAGWVELNDSRFSLTDEGRDWLKQRRSALLSRAT